MNVDVPNLLLALGVTNWRQNGKEIWAACPMPGHDETEPSWSIRWDPDSDSNGYHHCFGCEREGGPVHLVMEVIGFSGYGAARRWIEDRKLALDKAAPMRARVVLKGGGITGLEKPPGVVTGELDMWATSARRYAERRGITPGQVKRWGLGYGTEGALTARLWLPTYDRNGNLVNWAARTFSNASPRYLNPDRSEGPDVESIFGEGEWPGNPAHCTLLLSEGELDALALERAVKAEGRKMTFVGALGGASVEGSNFGARVAKLAGFTRIVLAMDPDRAGNKASRKLIASLIRWRKVRRLEMPGDLDACEVEKELGLRELRRIIWAGSGTSGARSGARKSRK